MDCHSLCGVGDEINKQIYKEIHGTSEAKCSGTQQSKMQEEGWVTNHRFHED